METSNFRVDLTDISAKTTTLVLHCFPPRKRPYSPVSLPVWGCTLQEGGGLPPVYFRIKKATNYRELRLLEI